MEIKVNDSGGGKTHVRYAVHYNDKNYEYALHSVKRHFIKNLADVVNVIEFCVMRDLKENGLYNSPEKLYNFNVVRLVNDAKDDTFDGNKFKGVLNGIVAQMVEDNRQRNA